MATVYTALTLESKNVTRPSTIKINQTSTDGFKITELVFSNLKLYKWKLQKLAKHSSQTKINLQKQQVGLNFTITSPPKLEINKTENCQAPEGNIYM